MAIRRRTLRSALSVFALASVLGLTACGSGLGGPGAQGAASASASGTPTPTVDSRPTPASSTGPARNLPKPELPAAARENTEAGFRAFTQYWFDTVTYALETGDTAPLKAISLDSCKMCASYISSASTARSDGGWRVGPRWTLVDFSSDMKLDPMGQAVGYFSMKESQSHVISADGSVGKSRAGGMVDGAQSMYAKFENGAWLASEAGMA